VVRVVEEPLFVLPVALGFGPKDDPPGYTFIVRAENALGRELHGRRWVESYRLGPPLNLPPPSSPSSKDPEARRQASSLLRKLDHAIWEHEVMVARLAGADGPARPGPDPTKIPSLSRAKSARPNYRSSGDVDAAWADAYLPGVRYRSEALEAGIDPDAEPVEPRPSPQEILSDAEYERAWWRDQAVTEQWKLVVNVRRHLLHQLQSGAISASVRPYDGGQWRALTPGDWNADLASLQRRFICGAMDPDRPFPGRGMAWPSGWWIFLDQHSVEKSECLATSINVQDMGAEKDRVSPAVSISKAKRGRKSSYNWDDFDSEAEFFIVDNGGISRDVDPGPEGFSQSTIEKHMADWTSQKWNTSPAESTIRDRVKRVLDRFNAEKG
jgi:hypothetical protein